MGRPGTRGDGEALVHDAHAADPSLAFALSRLALQPDGPTPIGIFLDVARAVHGAAGVTGSPGDAELDALLGAGDRWQVA